LYFQVRISRQRLLIIRCYLRQADLLQQCGALLSEFSILRGGLDQISERSEGIIPQASLSIESGKFTLTSLCQAGIEHLWQRNPFDASACDIKPDGLYTMLFQSVIGMCHKLCHYQCATRSVLREVLAQTCLVLQHFMQVIE
jgi:hypothetical protein